SLASLFVCRSGSLRPRALRPQLKRDPLGRPPPWTTELEPCAAPHLRPRRRWSQLSSSRVPPLLTLKRLHNLSSTRHLCSWRIPEVPPRSRCSQREFEWKGCLQTLTRHPAVCRRLQTLARGASTPPSVTRATSTASRFSCPQRTSHLPAGTSPSHPTRFRRPALIGNAASGLGGGSAGRISQPPIMQLRPFGVWIGPDGRYPTVGVSPPPKQV